MNGGSQLNSRISLHRSFLEQLETTGAIDAPVVARLMSLTQELGQTLEDVILELGIMSEATLAQLTGKYFGHSVPTVQEFAEMTLDVSLFPLSYQRMAKLAVIDCDDESFQVVTSTPFQMSHINAMVFQSNRKPVIKIAEKSQLERLLVTDVELDSKSAPGFHSEFTQDEDLERLKDAARDAPTVKLLNRLIGSAVDARATDIHLEPQDDRIIVRFRIDGSLQVFETVPISYKMSLVSRIKVLANLNIAETRLPQDGRAKMTLKGQNVDLRVSTAPIVNGESIALRVLNRNYLPLELGALGYDVDATERILRLINAPNGLVLMTGPTGSGKTTTLYTLLSKLNHSSRKLFSIEDPVEYRLSGINQIQVKPQIDLDFASVLRSVLRQDPDVIMVGEMRDAETASIAVRASMTGHLVLSTLHTNSAMGAISRLRDIGIDDFLLAATLRGVVAQRLIRKLCVVCSKVSNEENSIGLPGHHGEACPQCKGQRYFGRTVVYEILEVTPEFRTALARGKDENELLEIAARAGTNTLGSNGSSLIERGVTSAEELKGLMLVS